MLEGVRRAFWRVMGREQVDEELGVGGVEGIM